MSADVLNDIRCKPKQERGKCNITLSTSAATTYMVQDVQKFLIMNKERLLRFLPKFLEDRTDDDQFNDEKAWLVKAIGNLPDNVNAIKPPPDMLTQKPLSSAQTKS